MTRHCINSSSKTFHGDQWVTVEVEVMGSDSIKQWVNGELVFKLTDPQYDPRDEDAQKLITDENNLLISKGYISLQAESHPIDFKKIEVMELE
ncbi:MAG: family 16 glycoside hydrolase [Bacteroidota bacterium]